MAPFFFFEKRHLPLGACSSWDQQFFFCLVGEGQFGIWISNLASLVGLEKVVHRNRTKAGGAEAGREHLCRLAQHRTTTAEAMADGDNSLPV